MAKALTQFTARVVSPPTNNETDALFQEIVSNAVSSRLLSFKKPGEYLLPGRPPIQPALAQKERKIG